MEDKLIESIAYILPAVVTGLVAYYIFRDMLKQQTNYQKMQVLSEKKKETLPIKLKACERMLLFCDRINPSKLVIRVHPISNKPKDYANLLASTIEQEFEHNLVQQLYVSQQTWVAILAAKKAVIQKIRVTAENANEAKDIVENILIDYSKNISPTDTAKEFIIREVKGHL